MREGSARPASKGAEVLVSTRGGPFPDVSAAVLRRRAGKMLEHLGLGSDVELSVALVNDAEIRELNRSFRRKDKPTDVLAFPMSDSPSIDFPKGSSRRSPRAPRNLQPRSGLLGDVILSIETARRQAQANRRPLVAELTMLLAHGLLHLLGYDHQTDEEEREMTALTRRLEEIAGLRAGSATSRSPPRAGRGKAQSRASARSRAR